MNMILLRIICNQILSSRPKFLGEDKYSLNCDKHPQQWGYKYVRGNYQLMVDNLLDLSHVGFVHTSTLGSEESTRQHASGEQKQTGRIVSDYRLAVDVESPPAFAMMLPHLKKVDF